MSKDHLAFDDRLTGLLRKPFSRRQALLAGGGLAATATLAACGGGGGSAKKGSLTVWASTTFVGSATSALGKAAKEYGEKNGLDIEVQGFPANDLVNKITTALNGGGGPDVVIVDVSQVPQLGQSKLVVDVADRLAKTKKEYFPGNVAAATIGKATYAVPFDTSNVALFWNKKMFSKAGLSAPKTWDELLSSAQELTGGKQHGYMLGAKGYGSFLFWPWLWQNGGAVVDGSGKKATFASAEGVAAWQFYADLHLKHKVVPPTFVGVTQAWDQYIQPFLTEQVAMMAIGDWGIDPLKKGNPKLEYGVAALPKKTESATVLGGNSIGITKACKDPDKAWEFVSWLASGKQEKLLVDGYKRIPARTDISEASAAGGDEARKVFVDQAASARTRPTAATWGDIEWGVMADAWDSVVQKKKAPEQALADAAKAATKKLSSS